MRFELAQARSEALASEILARAADSDARVRFRAALALGGVAAPETPAALAGIAARDGEDRWTRAAVALSASRAPAEFLERLNGGGAGASRSSAFWPRRSAGGAIRRRWIAGFERPGGRGPSKS